MTDARRPSATAEYLDAIGVRKLPPRTSPFDPGYDPVTVESHLEQSKHLISILKISMASWIVADEESTRRKFAAARSRGIATTTGGGPFEVAVAQGRLTEYLDLVADMGATRIECGLGFTESKIAPVDVVRLACERGLETQFELGKKHTGGFSRETVDDLLAAGTKWLEAGAVQLVVEARESAHDVGLFDDGGRLDERLADRFADAFGLDLVVFEAPTKPSQFALLSHFGARVHLCNVRLEELLRVEIFRRGLHSDSFGIDKLRPPKPPER